MTMAKPIGNRIRLQRSIVRLSQEALGVMMTPPLKQQVISKMERGQKEPSASQLFQISHHLDVPISFFFEDIEAPKPLTVANAEYNPPTGSTTALQKTKLGTRNT